MLAGPLPVCLPVCVCLTVCRLSLSLSAAPRLLRKRSLVFSPRRRWGACTTSADRLHSRDGREVLGECGGLQIFEGRQASCRADACCSQWSVHVGIQGGHAIAESGSHRR